MNKKEVLLGLVTAILLILLLLPFASKSPDGLEKVALQQGFHEKGKTAGVIPYSLLADYSWPGLKNEKLSSIIAGITGVLIAFGVSYSLAYILKKCKRHKPPRRFVS